MSDIVERLRSSATDADDGSCDGGHVMRDAADEIERLRAELKQEKERPLFGHKECSECGCFVACWTQRQIEMIDKDAAMLVSKLQIKED